MHPLLFVKVMNILLMQLIKDRFHFLFPDVAVITCIAWDHINVFTTEDAREELEIPVSHHLLNLHAVWYVCKYFKIDAEPFVDPISNFTGVSKRLKKIEANEATVIYRDFAHAPGKVKAAAEALKRQYPGRKLIPVLELYTFSSLNNAFMSKYKGAMDKDGKAAVFYSKQALGLKGMPELPEQSVADGFAKENLEVITDKK